MSKAFAPPGKGTPDPPLSHVLWPDPATATMATSPRAVAREFVTDFIGVKRPALGPFVPADNVGNVLGIGEVVVYDHGRGGRRSRLPIGQVLLHRVDRRWFVDGASSSELDVSAPTGGWPLTSPARFRGDGIGDRGDIDLRVHAAFDPKPLALRSVLAETTRRLGFSAVIPFTRPPGRAAVIVARAGDAFAARRMSFAAPGRH